MYRQYKFDVEPKNVYSIGDLHGNWSLLGYKIKESGMSDSVIVVAGDCGFGFEKEEFYNQIYNKIKRTLLKQNVTIIFVRGNHDDPKYFDGEVINHKNFIAVPDYSILLFNNYNVLCVGGGISVDRIWRKTMELGSGGKRFYWADEIPVYKPEVLDKIKSDSILINTVISHTAPSFAPLMDKHGIKDFIESDKALIEDISYERMTLTKIYDHLIKDKHPYKLHIYGHFHEHHLSYSQEDVKFIMLDCVHTHNNSWDIYPLER